MQKNEAMLSLSDQSPAPFYDFFRFYRFSDLNPDIKPQWHKDLEILFCVKGEHELQIDGEPYTLKEGEVVIIPPNVSHSSIKPISGWINSLYVSPEFILSNGIKTSIGDFDILVADHELWNKFEEFYALYYADVALRETALRAKLLEILMIIYDRHFSPAAIKGSNRRFLQLVEYLDANYTEKITLSHLSKIFHYNKFYLSEKFKKETGRTIIDYVNHKRCNYADSLLKTTELKNEEIAEMCGFGSVHHFMQTYKKARGKTPGQTRLKHKEYLKNKNSK